MAIVNRSLIYPSGQAGDYIFRVRNGKLVMYRRPVKQKVSRSPKAEAARNSFAVTVKFAVCINSLPYLKNTWKNAKVKGTNHFQKIIKQNAQFIKSSGISGRNIITPPGIFFPSSSFKFDLNDKRIYITLTPTEEMKQIFAPTFFLHLVFAFYEPIRKSSEPFAFSGMENEISFNGSDFYNLSFTLNGDILSKIKKYKKMTLYSAASSSQTNSKVFWTSTLAINVGTR